jgi:hypothetical protein
MNSRYFVVQATDTFTCRVLALHSQNWIAMQILGVKIIYKRDRYKGKVVPVPKQHVMEAYGSLEIMFIKQTRTGEVILWIISYYHHCHHPHYHQNFYYYTIAKFRK